MSYPRFYIYAPRPADNFQQYFKIPDKQQQLIDTLRSRGFDFSINGVEPCKVINLLDMQGLLVCRIGDKISLATIHNNEDLRNIQCDEILLVQTYSTELNEEQLGYIHKMFSWIYGFTSEPRVTRSMNPIYWTPQPRIYVVATSSINYDKAFC